MWSKLFGIGALDGQQFTQLVVKLGLECGRLENPEVDLEEMRITDKSGMMNLGNMHAAFLQTPRRKRIQYIRDVVLAPLPDIPETWDAVKRMLVPVVRDGAYLTFAPLQASLAIHQEMPAIARRPLAQGLFETVVIDTPNKMMVVNEERLVAWGVTLADALDVAYTNLRRESQDTFRELMPGLWLAPWGDSYAASRILLPEILQRVCTNPLVAIPNRDTMFIADARNPAAFEMLVIVIEKAVEDGHYPITRRIFQLENKALLPYTPPADASPGALQTYERLLVEEAATGYEREKELHEQLESDAFYGRLMAFVTTDGEVITRAVWTQGIDTDVFLPPAQAIHFVQLEDADVSPRMWEVPWNAVAAEPGLLTPTDAPLPRWKAGAFPSPAWLEAHGTLIERGQARN